MSPAAAQSSIKSAMRIQLTQMGAMAKRYEKATGKAPDNWIDDNARQIIKDHGLADFARKELGAAYAEKMPSPPPQQQQKRVVVLADARTLPQNRGKSDAEIIQDIQNHGYEVKQ